MGGAPRLALWMACGVMEETRAQSRADDFLCLCPPEVIFRSQGSGKTRELMAWGPPDLGQ